MDQMDNKYLSPTTIIDSDHEKIIEHANDTVNDVGGDPVDNAVKLYYAVRDDIWYDPYYPFYLPEHYRASNILKSGRGFCVSKASLLCALGRACGIPSRVGFATVRNHLATKKLLEYIGSDLFVYHAFTEFYLLGRWVKATPAFNVELCRKHNVAPLEFNGREDSIFHAYDMGEKQFMEYLEFHGTYADIPVDAILEAWERAYGKHRVMKWIDNLEKYGNADAK
jgi:transglutaminase-like putative cysteine protease